MTKLIIDDLEMNLELDREALGSVSGGYLRYRFPSFTGSVPIYGPPPLSQRQFLTGLPRIGEHGIHYYVGKRNYLRIHLINCVIQHGR